MAERAGFRTMASEAAAECASAAERRGDLSVALRWARSEAKISPDDETSVARLIRLLDANGDRVGALSTYEALRVRLMNEFRATPSPENEAILAAIRRKQP